MARIGEPADLSIVEAGEALRDGSLTCAELMQSHLDRIAERDPGIGAFVHLAADEATEAALAADITLRQGADAGPLHGIPFAVKDLIDVEGWPVRFGSAHFRDRVAKQTAPAVQAMRNAGAIPLGLVATYELATVGPDATSLYPQPRNPWNRDHITGGSSSGSAAAVAAGMVRVGLGTDTGGSVRSPAAFCGVCGFKPEHGVVCSVGVQPLAPSLDVVGLIGRSTDDIRVAVAALTDLLPVDTVQLKRLDGLRIGYARAWGEGDPAAHPLLLSLMDDAASTLSLLGAKIELTELPNYAEMEAVAARVLQIEQAITHADLIADGGRNVGRMAYESLLWGRDVSPDAESQNRKALSARMDGALSRFDAVVTLTTLAPAPAFAAYKDGRAVWTSMRTIPFNLTGHAALSVPMGTADGLPMGLQIVGAMGRSQTVLQIGAAFEGATDHGVQDPYDA